MKDESGETLLRHWTMLREIPRQPRRIDAGSLQQKLRAAGFETTLRTIQRDLNKFSAILPLTADGSKPQGWSWEAHSQQLDVPALEPQAALVFYLAERYLRQLLPASTLDYLSPWFNTAGKTLDAQGNGLSEWRKKVRVLAPGQPLQPPAVDVQVQTILTQALLENRRAAVSYRPRNAKSDKEYVVNPLGLVVRDQTIYLVCTLWDYPDIKQLVLHRAHSATLLDEPSMRLQGFNLDDYIVKGEFGLPTESGKTLNLVADFDRKAAVSILERPLERNQKIEEVDDATIRLTATVPDTQELRWWLLGFGSRVEVIDPKFLRNELCQTIANMGDRYGKSKRGL